MSLTVRGGMALLIIVTLGTSCRQRATRSMSAQEGSFAFADHTGTHLMTLLSEDQHLVYKPEHLQIALCRGNQLLEVRFERRQKTKAGNTGRQTAANFERLEGDVFLVRNGKLREDDVCLLLPADGVHAKDLLPMQHQENQSGHGNQAATGERLPSECSPDQRSRLAARYRREVKECFILLPLGREDFMLAELQPAGKDLLAVEALASGIALSSTKNLPLAMKKQVGG